MEQERSRYGEMTGAVGTGLNILLAAAKLIIGVTSGAVSITADAVNNFSDAASSVVSMVGFHLAAKPADDGHPFGHARYEYVSGLVVAFLVLLAGVELLRTSIEKILSPAPVTFSPVLVVTLVLSILVKAGMWAYDTRIGKKIDSLTLLAAAKDSRNDAVATAAVLAAAIIAHLTGVDLDGWMGAAVALFILWSGIGLVRETTEPLLGRAPDPQLVDRIAKKIMSYDGVLGTHDLMLHDYGPGRRFASVHVELPAERNVLECHELIDTMERDFLKQENIHMVIHYDPIVTADDRVGEIRTYLAARVKEIHGDITIHDLRIVPGEKNTNVIFDCVVPHTCPHSEDEVKALISGKLREKYPNTTAIIKIDHSFVSLD